MSSTTVTYIICGIVVVIVIALIIAVVVNTPSPTPPPPPPPPANITPLPPPPNPADCDPIPLITGYMQNQNPRAAPCTAYPYINNLFLTTENNKIVLYARTLGKTDTCCYFIDANATQVPSPQILVESYDTPIAILGADPYSYNSATSMVEYILPPCTVNGNTWCTAFIRTNDTSSGIYSGIYKVYSLLGATIDPTITYPPPGSEPNPDVPQPFAFNTLNIQILKDLEFTIVVDPTNTVTPKYSFVQLQYQGTVIINVITGPYIPNLNQNTPILVREMAQLFFRVQVAPIPGVNPPMVQYMS